VRYVFLWVFVVYLIRHYDDRVRRATETAIAASMYYAILVAFCVLHFVPLLTPFFADWLYLDTKTYVDYFGTLRLSVPFENPNFLGFYAVQVLTYMIFFSRSRLRLFHIAAALLVIYFTASRTAWVTAAVALAAGLGLYAYLGAIRGRLAVIVRLGFALLLLAGAGMYFSDRIMQNSRLQAVFSAFHKGGIQNESNAAGRLEQTAQAWEFFKTSPVFGMGPSKYATFDYVDDQYALWFLRNGVLGACVIIAGLGLISWRFVRSQRGNLTSLVGALAFVAVIALELLTGEFLNNFRLFYLTWFIGTAILRGPAAGATPAGRGGA
jgi:O-antigen ligase